MKNLFTILFLLTCSFAYSQTKDTIFCFNNYEVSKITEIFLAKDSLEVELNNCNKKADIYYNLYNNVSKVKDSYALEIENYKGLVSNGNEIISDLSISNLKLKNQIEKKEKYFKYSIGINILLVTFLIIK